MPIVLSYIFTLFFITASLFITTPLFAEEEYYFQDEFNEERSANSADPAKWIVYPNILPASMVVQEKNGYFNLLTNNQKMFPYIASKSNPFPVEGDFSLEFSFQYNSIAQRGTGLVISLNSIPNNISEINKDKPEVYFFGIWQGTDDGFNVTYSGFCAVGIPCDQPGSNIYHTPSPNLTYHTVKLVYSNSTNKVYLDGIQKFTSIKTASRPTFLWMGNPTNQGFNASWTSFKVDYIRVKRLSPKPFLELPFDYQSVGKTFDDVALNPYSWFDHQYPLQNECCNPPVVNYLGETVEKYYKSHNGYDYSLKNGVELNTPVLAAASGTAAFKPWQKSGGAGNMIKINHGNGYQTWYEHLSSEDLLVSEENSSIAVNLGQQIGKVGMTGNTTGPHIHFSVFKDSNNDSSFDNELPFGVTDPLGWEGENSDPWSLWTNGIRGGNTSFNLFTNRAPLASFYIPNTGGTINTPQVDIIFPQNTSGTPLNIILNKGPFESVSNSILGAAPSLLLEAFDNHAQKIDQFLKPVTLIYKYFDSNLENINEDSLKIYLLKTETNIWEPLPTILNKDNKTATSQINHFSRFALMGEAKDITPPQTDISVSGDISTDGWYRSSVKVEFKGEDNSEGAGLKYTLFSLNGNDWLVYQDPLNFDEEGPHNIVYRSYDKAGNIEDLKTINFNIDKTPPEARIFVDKDQPGLKIEGIDPNQTTVSIQRKKLNNSLYTITDQAGNKTILDVKGINMQPLDNISINSIQYNNGSPIQLPKNQYLVIYDYKSGSPKWMGQKFVIKGEAKIFISYNEKQNKSYIYLKEGKNTKLKETKSGLVLLKLATQKGQLNYSY